MKNYVDLVAVVLEGTTNELIAVAPQFSGLVKGDEVIIMLPFGDKTERATVERVCTVAPNKDEYNFICGCYDNEPFMVIKIISARDVDWSGYKKNEENEEASDE